MNPLPLFVRIIMAYAMGASIGFGIWRGGGPAFLAIWMGIAFGAVLSIYSWVRELDDTPRVRLDDEVARALRQAQGDYRP